MIRLNNGVITWSLAIKECNGLYYDRSDINPIPACAVCMHRERCNYGDSHNCLEDHRSCFRYNMKCAKQDGINIYVNGSKYAWSNDIDIFMRGKKRWQK